MENLWVINTSASRFHTLVSLTLYSWIGCIFEFRIQKPRCLRRMNEWLKNSWTLAISVQIFSIFSPGLNKSTCFVAAKLKKFWVTRSTLNGKLNEDANSPNKYFKNAKIKTIFENWMVKLLIIQAILKYTKLVRVTIGGKLIFFARRFDFYMFDTWYFFAQAVHFISFESVMKGFCFKIILTSLHFYACDWHPDGKIKQTGVYCKVAFMCILFSGMKREKEQLKVRRNITVITLVRKNGLRRLFWLHVFNSRWGHWPVFWSWVWVQKY